MSGSALEVSTPENNHSVILIHAKIHSASGYFEGYRDFVTTSTTDLA